MTDLTTATEDELKKFIAETESILREAYRRLMEINPHFTISY